MSVRRRHTRLKHQAPMQIRVHRGLQAPSEYQGTVVDIGAMGVAFRVAGVLQEPIGPECEARITVRNKDGKTLNACGLVARAVIQPDGAQQIAVCFDRAYYDLLASMNMHQQIYVYLDPEAAARRAMAEDPGALDRLREMLSRYELSVVHNGRRVTAPGSADGQPERAPV